MFAAVGAAVEATMYHVTADSDVFNYIKLEIDVENNEKANSFY